MNKATRNMWIVVLCLCLGVLMGAAAGEDSTDSQHEAVAEASDEMDLVVVEEAPPEAKEERAEAKPSKTAVWIPGYWRWDRPGRRYIWVPGVWREPPEGLVWHPGHWDKTDTGWVWIGGHWGKPEGNGLVVLKAAPPPVKVETKPSRPGPDYVWVGGYWRWSGTKYVWQSGRWQRPSASGKVWVAGRYVRRPHGYVYVSGHWDKAVKARVVPAPRVRRPVPPKPPRRPVPPRPPRLPRRPPRPRR